MKESLFKMLKGQQLPVRGYLQRVVFSSSDLGLFLHENILYVRLIYPCLQTVHYNVLQLLIYFCLCIRDRSGRKEVVFVSKNHLCHIKNIGVGKEPNIGNTESDQVSKKLNIVIYLDKYTWYFHRILTACRIRKRS